MINILIADDHELIREGLKKILKKELDMEVLGEARNAQEVFDQVKNRNLSIVLLDISMPGLSGLDVLTELRRNYPKLPVLILSMHPEDRFAVRALKAGAAGYVTKDSAVGELVKAIRKVVTGGRYVSVRLAEKLADDLEKGSEKPLHETLSDREFQVMRMVAAGKKISEIAEELSLSISTVNTYRTRILEKMGMETNVQLTRYAFENHLIE
ncbi:MAG: response regulator transcription factor [Chloroflexota bacterium]|nr:response regulator transcription factor [Chloroflexota bacterium]